MVRRLLAYARRHPVKIFMMVIMPLLTGGALTGVLKQFGIRLPGGAGMKGMFGGGSRSALSIHSFISIGEDFVSNRIIDRLTDG